MNNSTLTTQHKLSIASMIRTLAAALCTSLAISAPSHAQSVDLVQTQTSTTTGIDLSIAPRIAAESILIEEDYLSTASSREQAAIDHANQMPETAFRHHYGNDTLVVETGVRLSRDQDGDGYYSAFSLEMDVDTRDQLEVYANIFLQQRFQSPQLLHSTRSFHLYGNSTSDEYRIEVTLTDDFPAGVYDLIIEIRDAWSDELLDSVSEANFSNLGGLPLEDESRYRPRNDGSSVVVEYAGAATPFGLLILVGAFIGFRRRSPIAQRESR